MALDPSELELEPEAVAARYERHLRETRPKAHEDLSDMLADHVARQKVIFIIVIYCNKYWYKIHNHKVGSLLCDNGISDIWFDSLRQKMIILE